MGYEQRLTRRGFLAGIVGMSLAYPTLDRVLEADDNTKKSDKEQEKRRLKKLEYLLNPPKKESYQVEDKKVELRLDNRNFALFIPKKTSIKESKLFKVLNYNPERLPRLIHPNINGKDLYLISRDYLKSEESKDKLKNAAKDNKLPLITPSWTYSGELYIPTNTIFVRLKSSDRRDKILKFGKENGLKLIKNPIKKKIYVSFELKNESKFVSPFATVKALIKEGDIKWGEPDAVFKLLR